MKRTAHMYSLRIACICMCLLHSSRLRRIRFDYTLAHEWMATLSSPVTSVLTQVWFHSPFRFPSCFAGDWQLQHKHTIHDRQTARACSHFLVYDGANVLCCCPSPSHIVCASCLSSWILFGQTIIAIPFHFLHNNTHTSTLDSDVRFGYSFVATKRFGNRQTGSRCTHYTFLTCVVTRRTTSFGKSAANVRLNQAFDLTSVMYVSFNRFYFVHLFFAFTAAAGAAGVFSRARLWVLLLCGTAISTRFDVIAESTWREIAFRVCVCACLLRAKTKITFMYTGINANLRCNPSMFVGFLYNKFSDAWWWWWRRNVVYHTHATNGIQFEQDSEITICQHAETHPVGLGEKKLVGPERMRGVGKR